MKTRIYNRRAGCPHPAAAINTVYSSLSSSITVQFSRLELFPSGRKPFFSQRRALWGFPTTQASRTARTHSTITSVSAVSRIAPMRDFTVNCSCRNTKASTSVMTMLILSMGATLLTSPSCKAR